MSNYVDSYAAMQRINEAAAEKLVAPTIADSRTKSKKQQQG